MSSGLAARNAAQQNTVNKLNQLTDVESQLKEAERIYQLDKHLYEQKVIGSQEFKQAENNFIYLKQKKNLTDQFARAAPVVVRSLAGGNPGLGRRHVPAEPLGAARGDEGGEHRDVARP